MTRITIPLITSVVVCVLLMPLMSRQTRAHAEDRLLPTAAIVPPTYTPVPTNTPEPTPTATAEPLPTAFPDATAAAASGTEATIIPDAPVSGRVSDVVGPIATAEPAPTNVAVATAVVESPVDTTTRDVVVAPAQEAPAQTVHNQPVIQPTAILLPTPAPIQPLTQPISKNPALQSSTGIVNSLHVWGTQPLVMLMLICGFAGVGFLYYGQKN